MNEAINRILNRPWIRIEIGFENIMDQIITVPRRPGLYSISTNTPKEILAQFGNRNDIKHYNLSNKIIASNQIPEIFTINQNQQELYCIYNGHHGNLRQRLIEHFVGTSGTACLALFELELLRDFNWRFDYLSLTEIEDYLDSKIFRTFLEQHLRARTGWPILCSQ
jgi:hypothetical protein